jgi:glucose-1-phosphate cytidylyltransferase
VKVVLFCGGLGLRIREASQTTPKPMISVGGYPILLHVMRYYAYHGHKDFILCLGYKADNIRTFFEAARVGLPNEYMETADEDAREQLRRELADWRITFAYTGLEACVGEELFLANYADVLTDAPLPTMVDLLRQHDMTGAFLCARPTYSFHVVSWKDGHTVDRIQACTDAEIWLNGGYFVFRREIFDAMQPGEELVEAPFRRLIEQAKLLGYRHEGFWAPMDTLKDRQNLNDMHARGERPWAVWEQDGRAQVVEPAIAVSGGNVALAA